MQTTSLITICSMLFLSNYAWAYLGPGIGTGFVGIIFGIVGAIVLGIIGFFYYPIKRLIKKIFGKNNDPENLT